MDPSEEKKDRAKPVRKKKPFILPIILIIIVLLVAGGIFFFLQSSSEPPLAVPEQSQEKPPESESPKTDVNNDTAANPLLPEVPIVGLVEENIVIPSTSPTHDVQDEAELQPDSSTETITLATNEQPESAVKQQEAAAISICSTPEKQLNTFYAHLDAQPYMASYKLKQSSQDHFTALITKLLANPPKVTRESDDLYTILKNTAHFFRIAGKNNIFMLKGILNNEKDRLEQILADYYLLITSHECGSTKYAKEINRDALYEYAGFFLNTMGGRLYLFRRDSQSRMVVTYYAILLVDLANSQQNNRHGIAVKPAIDMLISEMETGGMRLSGFDEYLDKLYDLKEKYQQI